LYQIVAKKDSKQLAEYLSHNGQALLPMVELIEQGQMVLRWAAAAYLDAENAFHRIMGYRDLWILQTTLDEHKQNQEVMVA